MRFFGALSLLLASLSSFSSAWAMTASVYKKDSSRKVLLYTYKNDSIVKPDGVTEAKLEFFDLKGVSVVSENATRKGTLLQSYSVDHKQTKRKGSITVEGSKVRFRYEDNGTAKKEQVEDLPKNFVVGPTLISYVTENWSALAEGKDLDIRFGVWDRQETVGFTLSVIGREKLDGQEVVLLRFKPTSFIIAALVDPVIFKFSADGKKLVAMVGRVMPKQWVNEKWKDLDAEVIYSGQ